MEHHFINFSVLENLKKKKYLGLIETGIASMYVLIKQLPQMLSGFTKASPVTVLRL